jgi:hypothetical protein
METELKIVIKGDVVQVTKSLDELQKEFDDLQKQLKTKTGKAFIDANKELDRLSETMKKVKNIGRSGFDEFGDAATGAGKGIQKAGQAAQGAAPALNSLGQVARDLPFGFVAIQNNLPIVADQFSALVKSSGGAAGALKALGATLIGPAGISFAIGAAIAGITALIQKYGSLGGAVDALFRSGDRLYQQQKALAEISKEANKNAGEEIARYKFLAQTASNAALPLQVRKDAIKDLQSEYGAYLANMTEEDILNGKLASSTDMVTKALQAKAMAQAAVAKAGELSAKSLDLLEKEEKLTADITALEIRREKEKGKFRTTQGGQVTDIAAETQRTINGITKTRDAIRKEREENDKLITALFDRSQAYNKVAGAGAISAEAQAKKDKEAAEAKKRAQEEELKRLKAINDAEKERLQIQLKQLEKQAKGQSPITDAWLQLQKEIANTKAKIEILGTEGLANKEDIRQGLRDDLADLNDDFKSARFAAGRIEIEPLFSMDKEEARKRYLALIRSVTATGFEEATATQGKVGMKAPAIQFGPVAQDNIEALDDMKKQTLELSDAFGLTLAPAIDAAFGALAQGKNAFQAIGESLKRLIVQIGMTIVKAAILAAILSATGLGPALGVGATGFKGFMQLFSQGLGFKNAAAPGVGGFAGAGIQAPSFGGITPGGFTVNIGGEFLLQGNNLVASVNLTNQRITRTG